MAQQPEADRIEAVRAYHSASKHRPGAFAPSPGHMDWANQPDPWRRFNGCETVSLPLSDAGSLRAYADLGEYREAADAPANLEMLGLVLELGLGVSAWKSIGSNRWALRNNPSSGNLHPVEAYVVAFGVEGLAPGIYHYCPREHLLERRCQLSGDDLEGLRKRFGGVPLLIGLASIDWREIWKYGIRGWRYSRHDEGHAIAALRLAMAVAGWKAVIDPAVPVREMSRLLGLDRVQEFRDAEAETPSLLMRVEAAGASEHQVTDVMPLETTWEGQANRLSRERRHWPQVDAIADALSDTEPGTLVAPFDFQIDGLAALAPEVDAGALIRRRRSAVDMDGKTGMPLAAFVRIMGAVLPDRRRPPFDAFPYAAAIHLLIYAHRIEGLAPGLYLLSRHPGRVPELIGSFGREGMALEAVEGLPLPLWKLIAPADARVAAKTASCNQDIAADGAFAVSMIADFTHTLLVEGADAYRRLFHECGMIGQVLYLEAEAHGLNGTGIGCFLDDRVHSYVGLEPDGDWQCLYNFAVGKAVIDERLTTDPGYPAEMRAARQPVSRSAP
jgi:SagB-type dehydrogenase family enzyme